jgi:hypothetical protein
LGSGEPLLVNATNRRRGFPSHGFDHDSDEIIANDRSWSGNGAGAAVRTVVATILLGRAPDLDVAFDDEADRDAARNLMELLAAADDT